MVNSTTQIIIIITYIMIMSMSMIEVNGGL